MLGTQPIWIQNFEELHLLTAVQVVVTLIVAILLTMFVRVLIRRILRRVLELPGSDRGRVEARQRALATALRGALVGLIWSTVVVVMLGQVGVNIGAFVATATVVGGAFVFGAQTMVRDLIAGFYVLAEDQYGVGDEVDLGLARGTVERITLRSVRLRDSAGVAWHVPHGGVARVGNMSKTSVTSLDLAVARHSPLATLDAAAASLCAALAAHPDAAGLLTGVPVPAGVVQLADDRLVYRLNAPSRPGKNDEVTAIWRRLALEAFEAGGLLPPTASPIRTETAIAGEAQAE